MSARLHSIEAAVASPVSLARQPDQARIHLWAKFLLLLVCFSLGGNLFGQQQRPNILLIVADDFYSTKDYTEYLLEWLERDKEAGEPFFAYLAYTAPHNPLHAPAEFIEKYRGNYDDGYEVLRTQRFSELKKLGLIDQHHQLPPWLWLQEYRSFHAWSRHNVAVHACRKRRSRNAETLAGRARKFTLPLLALAPFTGGRSPIYYVLAQFSKTIRPGDKAVQTTKYLEGLDKDALHSSATVNDDGLLSVQVLNTTKQPISYGLQIGAQHAEVEIPANAVQTVRIQM